ncbi:ImmA/IrrE family metallo-endopeptidase [Corynebacterium liangguodongii]|uniref:IrrE N-terminal-like domain-containing protein n=1 Tax=Corynebacterium liangguodongii TaxID=2079535 RepID=A0A2S0WCL7_9CORY|nr:ImmA/IrrE family metallo-endopeptidase [Corynebacterium liangguodongii]AWB83519.1 hypothetical protein C3E79_02615 [Corynebacterium liangguodongii]PWC00392.1 ImmA/IrrE family metallo-endopeptidase [Corynebacterium liangguodongii]
MSLDSFDAHLADLLTRIQDADEATRSYMTLLESVAKPTRTLSPFNSMLVQLQRPGAHHALSRTEWEKYARRPRHATPAIMILKPFGPVEPVFEFSDTEPIPGREDEAIDLTPPFELVKASADPAPYVNKLLDHACHIGIDPVASHLGDALAGDARRINRGVKVVHRQRNEHHFTLRFLVRYNQRHSPAAQFQTLAHEYAHVLLGHLGPLDSDAPDNEWNAETRSRTHLPRAIAELEAESVAYLVCMTHGVDGNSAAYLRGYVGSALDGKTTWPRAMSIMKIAQSANTITQLLGDYADITPRRSIRTVHPNGTTPFSVVGAPGRQETLFRAS